MPRYEYECEACGKNFEQRQSFTDDALTDCPLCNTEGSVQRLISQVGVVFKGTGFYINDSKKGNKKESVLSSTDKKSDNDNGADKAATETKDKTETTSQSESKSESKKESSEQKSTVSKATN